MPRINTNAILNNGYLSGGADDKNFSVNKISIAPSISSRYDFSVTEDQSLLIDRSENNEIMYKIFSESPYAEKYLNNKQPLKIEKKDIFEIFWYCKEKLEKEKSLTSLELLIAINEFFDFNYTYILNKVVSLKMKSEIYEDFYNNIGMTEKMNRSEKLF